MAQARLYRLVSTNGAEMLVDTFATECDLLERVQRLDEREDFQIGHFSVHVYDTGGIGRTYLGTLPAGSVLFQGKVDEQRLGGR